MKVLVTGDVHGWIENYEKILKSHVYDLAVQVGDFGFAGDHAWHRKRLPLGTHFINFGNHDYYPDLHMPHSTGDFGMMKEVPIFTVRGAESIDRHVRREGKDWWSNEQLSYAEANRCLEAYKLAKPRIVITHDCPYSVSQDFFNYPEHRWVKGPSLTNQLLQVMLENHRPEMWLFGHHHSSVKKIIDGTVFQCLNELEPTIIEA